MDHARHDDARRRFDIQLESPFWQQIVGSLAPAGQQVVIALGDETVADVARRAVAQRAALVAVDEPGRSELALLIVTFTPNGRGTRVHLALPGRSAGAHGAEIRADSNDRIAEMIDVARRLQTEE